MPSYSIGFWVATTRNGVGSGCGDAVDADLTFLHRFEQRRLRLRRRAVDLVGEHEVREHGAGPEDEIGAARRRAQRHRAGEIGGQHVGRELHATEVDAERAREGVGEQRLGDAGDAFEQHVAADGRRGEQHVDDMILADDHLRDLGDDPVPELPHRCSLLVDCSTRLSARPTASTDSSVIGASTASISSSDSPTACPRRANSARSRSAVAPAAPSAPGTARVDVLAHPAGDDLERLVGAARAREGRTDRVDVRGARRRQLPARVLRRSEPAARAPT